MRRVTGRPDPRIRCASCGRRWIGRGLWAPWAEWLCVPCHRMLHQAKRLAFWCHWRTIREVRHERFGTRSWRVATEAAAKRGEVAI